MARLAGISRSRTLLARLSFFLSRRSYGRVITPARVYALDSGLLLAVGLMEEVQERAKQTSAPVKQLARMLVARRVGCRLQLRLWHPHQHPPGHSRGATALPPGV
jgi:hypothetical protein